jgi:hypothetical protein
MNVHPRLERRTLAKNQMDPPPDLTRLAILRRQQHLNPDKTRFVEAKEPPLLAEVHHWDQRRQVRLTRMRTQLKPTTQKKLKTCNLKPQPAMMMLELQGEV